VTAPAQKRLARMRYPERAKMLFRIWGLKEDAYPLGCLRVKNTPYFRLRQGDWRIIYRVDGRTSRVFVVKIARRNERTYDGLS
jgi:mRNA-degrading endonuclease RelE of RelBE toxin-antitoxin system